MPDEPTPIVSEETANRLMKLMEPKLYALINQETGLIRIALEDLVMDWRVKASRYNQTLDHGVIAEIERCALDLELLVKGRFGTGKKSNEGSTGKNL